MALNIKNRETHDLARALAEATGETITEAVTEAIRHRLRSVRRKHDPASLLTEVEELQAFVASLPERDGRTPDEILGYDDFGLPGGDG